MKKWFFSNDPTHDNRANQTHINSNLSECDMTLRNKLIDIALQWQESFGVAPSITSALSEYDAAMLVGMSENEYSEYMKDKTAVSKGADFVFNNYYCPLNIATSIPTH